MKGIKIEKRIVHSLAVSIRVLQIYKFLLFNLPIYKIFWFLWFGQKSPPELLIIHQNIFVSQLNVHSSIWQIWCAQFCSAYFMNMHSSSMFKDLHLSRIQRNRTDLLSKFYRCAQSTESFCAVIHICDSF
jgi:hypothetical protein